MIEQVSKFTKRKCLVLLILGVALQQSQAQDQFRELAEGPYDRLVIRNAMVIPGHGGPPVGPYDIVVEQDQISEMIPFDPVTAERRGDSNRPTGDRIIDASGKYVMPGLIDLHGHLRQEPMSLEYIYYLKLAHGVTTFGPASDRGVENAMEEVRREEQNEILAPTMYPLWSWGSGLDYDQEFLENPDNADQIAREMVEKGAHQIYLNGITWNDELFEAAAQAVWDAGGVTGVHIPPSNTAVVDAVDAARLGVTMRPGYEADLLIVDGSPLHNLRFLYSFGAVTLDDNDEMYRTEGIVHTIKDGIVVNNDKLMEEVARMVKESKEGVETNIANDPFLIEE